MAQLVFFQPTPKRMPVCIGEMADYDECDEDIEDGCVPVRYRGRVMSAPMIAIRPVT